MTLSSMIDLGTRTCRFKSGIRGFRYHDYKTSLPPKDEFFKCQPEPDNEQDKSAIVIHHETLDGIKTVGYVPREKAKWISPFLKKNLVTVALSCQVTGEQPIVSNGGYHEIPCWYIFRGPKELIHQIEERIHPPVSNSELGMMMDGIKKIRGRMKCQRIVLLGPPCVGKSSLKQVIQNKPPLEKSNEKSTDILEPPERLITINRLSSNSNNGEKRLLKYVDGHNDLLNMITKEFRSKNKENNGDKHFKETATTPQLHDGCGLPLAPANNKASSKVIDEVPHKSDYDGDLKYIGRVLKSSKARNYDSVFSVYWTHVIDSGGQPQFSALLPLVFPSENNFYFVVIRLDEKLDDRPRFQWIATGGKLEREDSESLVNTNFQMIEQMCQLAKLTNSCIKIIGTHLDCVSKEESLKDKERQLQTLKDKYDDVIVCDDNRNAIFALNAVERDPIQRTQYTKELSKLITEDDSCKWCIDEDVDLSWLILEIAMSRKSTEGVLSYAEVEKIASDLNIPDVKEVLTFFSDLAVNFYFPSINPDLIFEKIDVITCNLSQMIRSTWKLKPRVDKELKHFKTTGLFKTSIGSKICPNLCKRKAMLQFSRFLDILQYLRIIHKLDDSTYFLPSVLPLSHKHNQIPRNATTPLLVFWEDSPLPPSAFAALIVSLLREKSVSLCRNSTQFRDAVYLKYQSAYDDFITGALKATVALWLVDRVDWMEIYLTNCNEQKFFLRISEIILAQLSDVLDRLKLSKLKSSLRYGLLCPGNECQIQTPHPCIYSKDTAQFECSEDGKHIWKETDPKRTVWFARDDSNSSQVNEDNPSEGKPSGKRGSPSQNEISNETKKSRLNKKQLVPPDVTYKDVDLEEDSPDNIMRSLSTAPPSLPYTAVTSSNNASAGDVTSVNQPEHTDGYHPNQLKHIATDSVSPTEIKQNTVFKLLKNYSHRWSDFGRELEISVNFREGLKKKSDLSDEDKLEKIIYKWFESSRCVTWSTLRDAMVELELINIADDIKKSYLTQNGSNHFDKDNPEPQLDSQPTVITSSRKRSSPSQNKTNNKKKKKSKRKHRHGQKKKSQSNKNRQISLKVISSSGELEKLTQSLHNEDLIDDDTHSTIFNPKGLLFPKLVNILEKNVNSTIDLDPKKLPKFIEILKEQDDPKLLKLAIALESGMYFS